MPFPSLFSRTLRNAALWATLASGSVCTWAQAASPLAQAPGYYVQNIGQMQVLALFDGVVSLPKQQLKQIAPTHAERMVQQHFVPETPEGLQTAVNAYLVRRGKQTLLVDTGTAQCFGPQLGQVLTHMKAAGVSPAAVQDILLTHAHPDHLCGLLDADGQMAYPNAQVWIQQEELAYWQNPVVEARATAFFKPLFGMARHALAPYLQAGRVHTFNSSDALPDGVRYLPAAGHTVDHSAFLVDGNANGETDPRQKLLLWGDVVHYHAVQFADPKATYEPDQNYAQSVRTRRRLLEQATTHRWWLAGAHLPFPGIGHVAREGKAYRWVPAEYAPINSSAR